MTSPEELPLRTEPQSTEADAASLELITESLRSQKQWQKLQDSCAEEARGAQARAYDEIERLQAKFVKLEAVFNRLAASSGGDMENLVELMKRVSGAHAESYADEEIVRWRKQWEDWHDSEYLDRLAASPGEDLDRLAEVAKEGFLIGSDEEVDAWRKRWEEWHAQTSDSFKGAEMDRVAEALRAHGFSDEEVASWRKGWEDWHARRAQNAPDALDVVDDGRPAVVVDDGRLADQTDADTVVTVTSDSDSDAGP